MSNNANPIFISTSTESGKVVIVLAGRYAGKKAVVVKTFDEGSDDKQFSHVLIAGIARGPRKVTRGMSKKKVEKRSRTVKPFVKYINVRHVFPTRYVVDMDLKKAVDEADLVGDKKVDVKKTLKKKTMGPSLANSESMGRNWRRIQDGNARPKE